MIAIAVGLLLLGLALSAFFSGSETGFYRVNRVRLVIGAVDGDWISWGLLQLTNHPTVFVATTLVGNNLANYTVSLGVVLLTKEIVQSHATAAELIASILSTPVVFVFGELLPKYVSFNAPNLLLRRGAPLFLAFACLFAPVSALLALVGLALQRAVGETPLRIRPALARKELQEVLQEGQEAGILRPPQRQTAQKVFEIGGRLVGQFCRPATNVLSAPQGTPREQLLRLASNRGDSVIVLTDPQTHRWAGYLRLVDLHLGSPQTKAEGRPLIRLRRDEPLIQAMIQLQSARAEVALVVDEAAHPVGLFYTSDAVEMLV